MTALPASAGEPVKLDPADFARHDPALVALGRDLFFDPVLSGNRNISCASCHHPDLGTGDGVAVSLGEGGKGLGPKRVALAEDTPEQRIPRNAPPLFNIGHKDISVLFHDGRLEKDPTRKAGFRTPMDDDMVSGFSGIVSAQSMFPVLSSDEMAGHYSENEVSRAVRQGLITGEGGAWDLIARRVEAIPAYRERFASIDPALGGPGALHFTDISNAVAAFMEVAFRADQTPYDRYLAGETEALSAEARLGMDLFFGKAGCAECHSGALLSDQAFHAIAMPQVGPGKTPRFETLQRDLGRNRVTGHDDDLFRFRTPMLRNVALTAPYGHSGAYATLEGVVRHHLDPVAALRAWDRSQVVLPELPGNKRPDFAIMDDPAEVEALAKANTLAPRELADDEVAALVAFLRDGLTDEGFKARAAVPATVPSGLPVDR